MEKIRKEGNKKKIKKREGSKNGNRESGNNPEIIGSAWRPLIAASTHLSIVPGV